MERIKLPPVGLGTWMLTGKTCTEAVLAGLEIGYRFIDTAQAYGNEDRVGDALNSSSIHRKDIILATKINVMNYSPRRVRNTFADSLKKLQTDYVDVLYVHWPIMTYKPQKTLGAMNELVKKGTVKYIGVSNFPIYRMKEAIEVSENPILANQMEMHPSLRLQKLHAFNTENNVYTIAYSPLGRGKIWDNPILVEVAQKNHCSVQQVCLAYLMSRGAIPIPKASSREHLQANWESQEVKLSEENIAKIETIPEKRILNFPVISPKWDKDD